METELEKQPIEVVFTFDTTGSMSPCLGQVRRNVDNALAPLFKEMPNLKIGLCAHGDYCDAGRAYVTKWQDLTNDLYKLTNFVKTTGDTWGGDADECYELVLHEAQKLNWSLNSTKILVVIGDANPHGPSYPQNTMSLNWQLELDNLVSKGITVYSVQCLNRSSSNSFYSTMAAKTGGYHLSLDQFADVVELIKAIVYKQNDDTATLQSYEEYLISQNKMNRALDKTFATLTGRAVSEKYSKKLTAVIDEVETELVPVPAGRFQVLEVDETGAIREFVEKNGLTFKTGRGFYEFTKREEIQEKKEVILKHRVTGDMFSGDQARNIIGLPKGRRGNVSPKAASEYQVFVQSTSYNRKLIAGTKFLYEVDLDR